MEYEELTKELIEEKMKEFFKHHKPLTEVFPVHYEWEENGVRYSAWKIGNVWTGDGGKILFDEVSKKMDELLKKNAS